MSNPSNASTRSIDLPSDPPPSYVNTEAEPHGYLNGKSIKESTKESTKYYPFQDPTESLTGEQHGYTDSKDTKESPFRDPPEPSASECPSPRDLTTQDDTGRDSIFIDIATGEPRIDYTAPDEVLTECMQSGHVKKTRFGTWSIFAAIAFFPWGLMFLLGARIVYCGRCGLVLHNHDIMRGLKFKRGKNPFSRRREPQPN